MTTTTATTPAIDPGTVSRAEQRKQRLLEIEAELALEEAEALKMTEEQRRTLLQPFKAVKVEFDDLDGLRWTQTALQKLQPQHKRLAHRSPCTSSATPSTRGMFVVLTNSDLASFAPEETIRVPSSSRPNSKSRPSIPPIPAPSHPGPHPPTPSSDLATSTSFSIADFPITVNCRHRDGSHARSPVKGLFTARSSPALGSKDPYGCRRGGGVARGSDVRISGGGGRVRKASLVEQDITDSSDEDEDDEGEDYDMNMPRSLRPSIVPHGHFKQKHPGPPGLVPAPDYEGCPAALPTLTPKPRRTRLAYSVPPPAQLHPDDVEQESDLALGGDGSPLTRPAVPATLPTLRPRSKSTRVPGPFPSRDAPSPPSRPSSNSLSLLDAPPSSSTSNSSLLDAPPTPSMPVPFPLASSPPSAAPSIPASTCSASAWSATAARKRLHSLLSDTCRQPPSSSTASRALASLELATRCKGTKRPAAEFDSDPGEDSDDEQTPMPSPVRSVSTRYCYSYGTPRSEGM